jgi:hypothetical protein
VVVKQGQAQIEKRHEKPQILKLNLPASFVVEEALAESVKAPPELREPASAEQKFMPVPQETSQNPPSLEPKIDPPTLAPKDPASKEETQEGFKSISPPIPEKKILKKTQAPLNIQVMPMEPKQDSETILYSDRPDQAVNFSWKESSAGSVHLQVSKSADFAENSIDTLVSASGYSATSLASSSYYWRVKAEGQDINSSWSPAIAFKITRGILLETSNLIYPKGRVKTQSTNSVEYYWLPQFNAQRFVLSINDSQLGQKVYFTSVPKQNVFFSGHSEVNWKVYALVESDDVKRLGQTTGDQTVSAEITGVKNEFIIGLDYHSYSAKQLGPQSVTLNPQGQGPDLNLLYSHRLGYSNFWMNAQAQLQSNSLSASGTSAQAINLDYALGLERRYVSESSYVFSLGAKLEKTSTEALSTSSSIYTLDDYYFSPYVDFIIPMKHTKDFFEIKTKFALELSNPLQTWFITPEVIWWDDNRWGFGLSYKQQNFYYGLPQGPLNYPGGYSNQIQQLNAEIYYKFMY